VLSHAESAIHRGRLDRDLADENDRAGTFLLKAQTGCGQFLMRRRPGLGIFDEGMAAFLGNALGGFRARGRFIIQGRGFGPVFPFLRTTSPCSFTP
jgi:hypothetical protein